MAVYPPRMNQIRSASRRIVGLARSSARLARPSAVPAVRERGQALVLFVLMSLVMIGSVAIVTDISWLWYGNQRMQRAADAAALAGAIYLPGNPTLAYSTAQAEATKNGYTTGVGGVTVTPLQDVTNKRRLLVTVSGSVNSFFAQALGISSFASQASSKAEYVLPVPMGSPDDYYGVGDFLATVTNSNTANSTGDTDWHIQTARPSAVWTTPQNADLTTNSAYAVSGTAAGSNQRWQTFGMTATTSPVQPGASSQVPLPGSGQVLTITGLQLQVKALLTGSGSTSNCQLQAELSWDSGTTWSTPVIFSPALTTGIQTFTAGNAGNTTPWGAHVWTRADLSTLWTRLTWLKPGGTCGASRTVSVDTMGVKAYWSMDTTTVTYTDQTQTITSPTGATLPSKGFWGAIITSGGNRSNGDQFSPKLSGSNPNPDYDSSGYDYTVVIKGASGQVQIFDAPFCEVGSNGNGGTRGTGDHWIGGAQNGVTTIYSLYDENGTPYVTTDDTLVASSGNLFANEIQADATQGSTPNNTLPHTGLSDCSTDPYHDAWYRIASGLSAGTYRLNVSTVDSRNDSTNAENMWSIWAGSAGGAKIYGEGRMVAYTNLTAGKQTFYLAQIDAVHAGKTMQITLHDPGDVSGNAYLRILSPDGNAYNYATFSYTATNGLTGTNVNVIQTANGSSLFDNQQLTILIPLPTNYGSGGLTPSGETEAGWWKIEYQVNGGNDTTTWQVAIRGSPVHLVP